MKKQKRYESEQEIMDEIDQDRARAIRLGIEADEQEAKAKDHAKKADYLASVPERALARAESEAGGNEASHRHHSKACFAKSEELRKKVNRVMEKKLPALGRTLAAFRTAPMVQICGKDEAVVAVR